MHPSPVLHGEYDCCGIKLKKTLVSEPDIFYLFICHSFSSFLFRLSASFIGEKKVQLSNYYTP